ncbi:MAG: hypothetical protein UZ21_OP11001000875 [Microgenomates bacterium OLB22]|nr:MAG: hypothetical protein UZ21_OP11001000875 [Microgenomates bacterium OLB22]
MSQRVFDLEERTAALGENVITICMKITKNEITKPLIVQVIKSATSIGANYAEADDAESKKDFHHKIGICKKESRETKHFLRMLKIAVPQFSDSLTELWHEAKELNLIFNTIYRKVG